LGGKKGARRFLYRLLTQSLPIAYLLFTNGLPLFYPFVYLIVDPLAYIPFISPLLLPYLLAT
jgi:hypothetical protein